MPLTELQIKGEKPGDKPKRLSDAHGLYLLLNTDGSSKIGDSAKKSGEVNNIAARALRRVIDRARLEAMATSSTEIDERIVCV